MTSGTGRQSSRDNAIRQLEAERQKLHSDYWRMRSRRLWRLAIALRDGLSSPRKLVRLPARIRDVVQGEPPKIPALPPMPKELTADVPTAELRGRLLAPPKKQTTKHLRVAGILDTFTTAALEPECELQNDFRPDNWQAVLKNDPPDLLLVESAWKGNQGAWQYKVGKYAYPESVGLPDLTALVRWCRDNGIPSVFWNKEDPVHYRKFVDAAKLFDAVLTTDENSIAMYEQVVGADTVLRSLPFAAQPAIHNPKGSRLATRINRPVFAGTYYRNRHAQRRQDLDMLLDAALPYELIIFDRMGGKVSGSTGYPERFRPAIRGGLPYSKMVDAYRQYRLFLNTNSVTDSPTMFSRRVFELLASGTPVVSTPSLGMETLLGSAVTTVRSAEGARTAIGELLEDDRRWEEASSEGKRLVFSRHTYAHRLAAIADAVGYEVQPETAGSACVVMMDDGNLVLRRVADLASRWLPGCDVVVGSTTRPTGPTPWPHVRIVEQGAGGVHRRTMALADGIDAEWIVVAGDADDDFRIAADLLTARHYAKAGAIGIGTAGLGLEAGHYVRQLAARPVVLRRDALDVWDEEVDDDTRGSRLLAAGLPMFCVSAAK